MPAGGEIAPVEPSTKPAPAQAKALHALPDSEQSSLWRAFGEARRSVTALTPREAAMPNNAGVTHFAQNPGQDLTLRFQSGSVRIGSGRAGSEWELILHLDRAGETPAHVQGTRVEFRHGAQVTEWWENRAEGIEQGFTVAASHGLQRTPEGVIVPITVNGLQVEQAQDGLRLVDEAGRPILAYGGLKAWDARGQALPATMRATGAGLELAVNDSDAVYPVTIDPLITSLETKLEPEMGDGAAGDLFGISVALDGDTALVGTWFDDTAAGEHAGSAYVFVRNGGSWIRQAALQADNGTALDYFGYRVALAGDTALVGTYGADAGRGCAYVFVRSGTNWSQQAKLVADDRLPGDRFGSSVTLDGDTALVGARSDTTTAGSFAGSAYVFVRSGTNWSQQAKLVADDGAASDQFGSSVVLDDDTALVGACYDDTAAGTDAGSAYVFVRSGVNWSQQAKLVAADGSGSDLFGWSVALHGTTAMAGARYHDTPAGSDAGSAYVFVRTGGTWSQQAKLGADDGAAGDLFGSSVALDGDTVLIGACGDDTAAGTDAGSAYVFVRSGVTWSLQAKVDAGDGAMGDSFGIAVALDADAALVGAYEDNTAAGGNAGSTYVFGRSGGNWSQQAKLEKADETRAYDFFGISVALQGDAALVGAYSDDTPGGTDAGSAYVFARSGTNWSQQAKLVASDGASLGRFGSSVALDRETALVGAYMDDTTVLDGGSAYVFVRSGTSWSQQAKLEPSDGAIGDRFGNSVAVDGDTALVGANYDDTAAGSDAGSAYVFARSGTSWSQQAKLLPSDGAASDYFGFSAALAGDTALVGAYGDDTSAGSSAGSAYVFLRSGGSWNQQAKLEAADGAASDYFGFSVALAGDTALVGARYDDTAAGTDAGSAYVFVRSGGSWNQQAKLGAADGAASDYFGFSVALAGDTALVGAYGDDTSAGSSAGSAYVFLRSAGSWSQQAKLVADDGAADDDFGCSVALAGDTVLVGAYRVNIPDPEGGGTGYDQGSVYVFRLLTDPEIAVEQPVGTEIADGGSRGFGGVLVGATNNLIFTIRNTGTTNLTGLGITIDGADEAMFVVTADPTAPVASNGSTAFTVQFVPTSPGAKAAALHIASNDPDENPYDISLSGAGLTAVEAWRQQYFGTTENAGNAADLADPEQDGIPNLVEFGFGCHPLERSPGELPGCDFDGSHLRIDFTEPAGVDGIIYGAEYSTNLVDWHPVSDAGIGTEHIFSISTGSNRRMFLRLIVSGE